MRTRTIPALIAIAATALALTGCGGSAKPQVSLKPATITGPLPTTTTLQHRASAKLTAFEYRTLKALRAKVLTKQSLAATQPKKLREICRSIEHRTGLLIAEGKLCVNMIDFLVSTLHVGNCFKAIQTSGATPGSPSYLAALYRCDRSAAPVARESRRIAANLTSVISVARDRGFTGRCFNYLAGSSSPATDLMSLSSQTKAMASAGLSQNLTAAVTATRTWAAMLAKVSKELGKGPKSIKVCGHT